MKIILALLLLPVSAFAAVGSVDPTNVTHTGSNAFPGVTNFGSGTVRNFTPSMVVGTAATLSDLTPLLPKANGVATNLNASGSLTGMLYTPANSASITATNGIYGYTAQLKYDADAEAWRVVLSGSNLPSKGGVFEKAETAYKLWDPLFKHSAELTATNKIVMKGASGQITGTVATLADLLPLLPISGGTATNLRIIGTDWSNWSLTGTAVAAVTRAGLAYQLVWDNNTPAVQLIGGTLNLLAKGSGAIARFTPSNDIQLSAKPVLIDGDGNVSGTLVEMADEIPAATFARGLNAGGLSLDYDSDNDRFSSTADIAAPNFLATNYFVGNSYLGDPGLLVLENDDAGFGDIFSAVHLKNANGFVAGLYCFGQNYTPPGGFVWGPNDVGFISGVAVAGPPSNMYFSANTTGTVLFGAGGYQGSHLSFAITATGPAVLPGYIASGTYENAQSVVGAVAKITGTGSGTLVSGSALVVNPAVTPSAIVHVTFTSTLGSPNVGSPIVPSNAQLTGTFRILSTGAPLDNSTFKYTITQ